MTYSSVELLAPVDTAWAQLQNLQTWEGVAGMEELENDTHDSAGNLTGFSFAIDTAVGRVNGRATVRPDKPAMTITGEQRGLAITLKVMLEEADTGSIAHIDAKSKATSMFSKPLELALNALLDSALDDEAAKIAERVN